MDGNPTGENVDGGVAVFKSGNHDGVIAFGGGSALDAGKAIAFMANQSRPLWDFEDVGDNWLPVPAPKWAVQASSPMPTPTSKKLSSIRACCPKSRYLIRP